MKDGIFPRGGKLRLYFPALLAGILLTMIVVGGIAWSDMERGKKAALHTAEVYAARTEMLLNALFHKTDVLEAILIADGGRLTESVFQDVARSLADGNGIRAIQCLPDGVVAYCYPQAGNEAAIGDSVFLNPERRADAQLAVQTRRIALSGPYTLLQGGLGLVARNPIFFTDDAGQEYFWGFSAIILDLPAALEPILLDELRQEGYAYRLHCVVEEMAGEVTIAAGGRLPDTEWIRYEIQVPNHVWTLTIAPEAGWANVWKLGAVALLGLFISVLSALVIRQKRERERVLYHFANTDELTGLINRRCLDELMEARCRSKKQRPFALLYMDLDGFKAVNDTLGHAWGDALLEEAARRLRLATPDGAVLARVGGDEFVTVLDGGCETTAVAERIEQSLSEPFQLENSSKAISVSIGWALFPQEGCDYDALMKIADQRMYRRKRVKKTGKERKTAIDRLAGLPRDEESEE